MRFSSRVLGVWGPLSVKILCTIAESRVSGKHNQVRVLGNCADTAAFYSATTLLRRELLLSRPSFLLHFTRLWRWRRLKRDTQLWAWQPSVVLLSTHDGMKL